MIDTGVWQAGAVGFPGGWVTLQIAFDRPWALTCNIAQAMELRAELDAAIAAASAPAGPQGVFKRTRSPVLATNQSFPICKDLYCHDPRCPTHT